MKLFPAIDLRGGRCVRLYQGDYDNETIYNADPVSQVQAFIDAGVEWIHVVDLDAARTGEPTNREVIGQICRASSVPVQVGGGVRSVEAAQVLFALGVERVVIGTAAIKNPELVGTLAKDHSVAVGLDNRKGLVATHGWTERSASTVIDLADRFANTGVEALIVTEIGVDGTLAGPDVVGLSELLGATNIPVVASGGVGTLEHLKALAAVRVDGCTFAGVIVGKAIYEQVFSAAEALEALGERPNL